MDLHSAEVTNFPGQKDTLTHYQNLELNPPRATHAGMLG